MELISRPKRSINTNMAWLPALRQLQGPASLDPRAINGRRASGAGSSTLDDDPIDEPSPVRPTTPRAAAADRAKRLKNNGWVNIPVSQPNATGRPRNPMPVLIVSRKELDEGEPGAEVINCWGKKAPSMKKAADMLGRKTCAIGTQLRMLLSAQRRTRWYHDGELIYVLHEDVTDPLYGRLQFVQARQGSTPKRRRSTRDSLNKAPWPSWDKAGTPGGIPQQSTT